MNKTRIALSLIVMLASIIMVIVPAVLFSLTAIMLIPIFLGALGFITSLICIMNNIW